MMDVGLQEVGGKSTPHSATAISYSGNVEDFCNITKTNNKASSVTMSGWCVADQGCLVTRHPGQQSAVGTL